MHCRCECNNMSCRKMKMVLKHYEQCRKKRKQVLKNMVSTGQRCNNKIAEQPQKCYVCLQLVTIVSRHSMFDCTVPYNQSGCPLFMCDSIRKMYYLRTLAKCKFNIIL